MPTTVTVNVRGLKEMAKQLGGKAPKMLDQACRRGVTFVAKDYAKYKHSLIYIDVDRPAPFTRRPNSITYDGANRSGRPIQSRAYVNTKQSDYLLQHEIGGTRYARPGRGGGRMNKARSILVPGIDDKFGGLFGRRGIEKRFLNKSNKGRKPKPGGRAFKSKYAAGAKRYFISSRRDPRSLITVKGEKVEGLFIAVKQNRGSTRDRRKKGFKVPEWKTRLLVRFRERARYKGDFHFRRDGERFGQQRLAPTIERLFRQYMANAGTPVP